MLLFLKCLNYSCQNLNSFKFSYTLSNQLLPRNSSYMWHTSLACWYFRKCWHSFETASCSYQKSVSIHSRLLRSPNIQEQFFKKSIINNKIIVGGQINVRNLNLQRNWMTSATGVQTYVHAIMELNLATEKHKQNYTPKHGFEWQNTSSQREKN